MLNIDTLNRTQPYCKICNSNILMQINQIKIIRNQWWTCSSSPSFIIVKSVLYMYICTYIIRGILPLDILWNPLNIYTKLRFLPGEKIIQGYLALPLSFTCIYLLKQGNPLAGFFSRMKSRMWGSVQLTFDHEFNYL